VSLLPSQHAQKYPGETILPVSGNAKRQMVLNFGRPLMDLVAAWMPQLLVLCCDSNVLPLLTSYSNSQRAFPLGFLGFQNDFERIQGARQIHQRRFSLQRPLQEVKSAKNHSHVGGKGNAQSEPHRRSRHPLPVRCSLAQTRPGHVVYR